MKTYYIIKTGPVSRSVFIRAGLRSGALLGLVLLSASVQAVAETGAAASEAVAADKPQEVKKDNKESVKTTLEKIADLSPNALAAASEEIQKSRDPATAEKARDKTGSAERKALKEEYQASLSQAQNESERERLLIEYQTLQRSLAADAELRQREKSKN